jgi:hypothetical protein
MTIQGVFNSANKTSISYKKRNLIRICRNSAASLCKTKSGSKRIKSVGGRKIAVPFCYENLLGRKNQPYVYFK